MHKHVANPVAVRLPQQTLLETVGRRSGAVRRTPVDGCIVGERVLDGVEPRDQLRLRTQSARPARRSTR
ncbi:nitroreductase/quinone reductase family protein [Rhodococcus sp. HM1]|uniref:nitroreductase/quinone reductase family protein n=1 Tax=Rhodococcus sp. HM1 TaxID=2937759 RepID=UPI0034D3F13D